MSNAPDEQAADTPDYLAPYQQAAKDLGPTFGALLWKNERAQALRFAAIASAFSLTGRVIADLGCGRADLAVFLHRHQIEYGHYVGVEGVAELATAAKQVLSEGGVPEAAIVGGDFVADPGLYRGLVKSHRVDAFVYSGSLNTLQHEEAARTLDRAFDALEPGGLLIFNFLTDRPSPERVGQATGPANRFETVRLIGWALDRTHLVTFRQDYLDGHDATIAMRKP